MEEFLGRKKELNILQKLYNRASFGMAVVYGRRRIGKTMLVNEFMRRQDCRKISFTAVEQNEKALLSLMKDTVLEALAPDMRDVLDFSDFDRLFEFIGKCAAKERVIFFIDEYPYLVKQCPYIQSILQKQIDNNWKNANLFFVICGSLVGFMKDEVLSESAPLYGRSDLELKLRPFNYTETALFLENYTNEEKAIVYGLTGGVAKYIKQFSTDLSLDENITEQFYDMGGYFSEEQIKTVITGDRQNPAIYNSIISAVASGHTKNSEIAVCSGMDDITYHLKVLVNAEILEKRISKKPYYRLTDSTLEFWFKYVNRAVSLINAGNGAKYYEANVKPAIHDFMGTVFEKMAKEFLLQRAGTSGIPVMTDITDFQNSVLNDNGKPQQVEIDLWGMNEKNVVLVGECKFRNEEFGKGELDKFMEKVRLIHAEDAFLCIFSLSGYTDYVAENAGKIRLISIDEMYESGESYEISDKYTDICVGQGTWDRGRSCVPLCECEKTHKY